jgi:hypothetical protein
LLNKTSLDDNKEFNKILFDFSVDNKIKDPHRFLTEALILIEENTM